MPDYDSLPLDDAYCLPESDCVFEQLLCCARDSSGLVKGALGIASCVQLAWPESYPPSLSPLPHLHRPNCSHSPNQSHNYPLYQVSKPLLHHGHYETRHSWPLEIPTPPPSNTQMIYSQS
jgi:hypothetical protein